MSDQVELKLRPGKGAPLSYVVEGATLFCTLGTIQNQLQIPMDHYIYINDKKQANIADHVGGVNILSFGPCRRSLPPPPCIMATSRKWVNGKPDVYVDDELALLNISVNFCNCGGIVFIINDGQ